MRRRTEQRKERRAKKAEAQRLRRQNQLCECADDERFYPDETTADADREPMKACETCGLERLIVKVICPTFAKPEIHGVPMEVAARAVYKDILR